MSTPLIHGGDQTGYLREYGRQPLDFSANTNPLGLPAGVRDAVIAALDKADAYPDPLCRDLRDSLSHAEGVAPSWIRCGNGAADLIFRLVWAVRPQRALLIAPTFAEYELALQSCDCAIDYHVLRAEDGWQPTETILDKLTDAYDMLFLCNPNNPTGLLLPDELLQRIANRCHENGIVLVMDECFLSLLDGSGADRHSLKPLLTEQPRLILLKAFTKLYGMAGIRLGYLLCGDETLLQRLDATGQPWSVSSLAQAAGIAALQETEYVQRSLELIRREKRFLLDGLNTIGKNANTIEIIGAEANYIFFATPFRDLAARMRRRGILIRSCANYHGLDSRYYRIAVRTHHENELLLRALQLIIAGQDE